MPIPAAYQSFLTEFNAPRGQKPAATKPATLTDALSAASGGARMPAGSLGRYGDRLMSVGIPFTEIYNTNPQAQPGGKGGMTPMPPVQPPPPPPPMPPQGGKGGFQARPPASPPRPPQGGKGGVGGPAPPRAAPRRVGP